jgi:hypothetical protein
VNRGKTTYAEACQYGEMNKENTREVTDSDSGEEWRVRMRKKERRKKRKMINNEERKASINEERREINRKYEVGRRSF